MTTPPPHAAGLGWDAVSPAFGPLPARAIAPSETLRALGRALLSPIVARIATRR